MIPYIVLAFVPIIFGELTGKASENPNQRSKVGYTLFGIILILLLSLRGMEVGADTSTYEYLFTRIKGKTFEEIRETEELIELGFAYLTKLSSYLGDYQMFLAIVALITVVPLMIFYYKESKNYILVIALFMMCAHFNMLFTGLRQVVAITLVIPAYYFTKNKKLILFLLTVVAAMLFHASAFIMIFIFPLYHIRIKKMGLLAFVPFIVLGFAFNEQIFEFLVQFLNERYAEKYGVIQSTGAYTMLILFAIFVIFAFVIPDESKMSKDIYGMRNMLIMCVLLQMFAPLNTVAMRMNFYYMIFIPIALPKIIDAASDEYKGVARLANTVLSVFFLFYSLIAIYKTNAEGGLMLYPYNFMWQ